MGGSAELGTSIICKHLKVESFHSILLVDQIHETIRRIMQFERWKSNGLNPIKRKTLDKKRDHFDSETSDLSSLWKNDVEDKDKDKLIRKGDIFLCIY